MCPRRRPADSGDPRESPRLYSGPFTLRTIALIGTALAMAYAQETLPSPSDPFPPLLNSRLGAWLSPFVAMLVSPTKLEVPQGSEGAGPLHAPHRASLRACLVVTILVQDVSILALEIGLNCEARRYFRLQISKVG